MTTISASSLSSTLFQQSRQALFQSIDADSSGGINLDEFKAAAPTDENGTTIQPPSGAPSVEDVFASLDTDSDGSLTQSELEATSPPLAGSGGSLQSLLSKDAFVELLSQSSGASEESAAALFDAIDTNEDGSIDLTELETLLDQASESNALSSTEEDSTIALGGGGKSGGGAPPAGASEDEDDESSSAIYDPLDTNEDGKVSLQELLAANDQGDNSLSSNLGRVAQTAGFLLSLQEQQAA